MHSTPKIVLAGAGRIAWHLGRRLKGKGLPVAHVVNRTESHARRLAQAIGASWSDDWQEVPADVDWLLIAVRDDAIAPVAEAMASRLPGALATHTSGATPGTALAPFFRRYGVFYPLQSFSMERSPVWSKIPFCVDAAGQEDLLFLKKMAKIIGNHVYRVDDAQRAMLHVAAVFANNFTNHCFAIAEKLLDAHELPFEMLHPLMEETLQKALADSPVRMQTGPAIRGDEATIRRHLDLLNGLDAWQDLYERLSRDIRATREQSEPGDAPDDPET